MASPFPIRIGRVYDPPGADPGARLLIDRLWPRGLSKATLHLDAWLREATPSTDLRKWYHADPDNRREEFRTRYRAELAANPAGVVECLDWCRKGPVLLLTAAHDIDHSHAPVLREALEERLGARHSE